MESPIKMDDLGGFPLIFGNTHILLWELTYISLESLATTWVDDFPFPSRAGNMWSVSIEGMYIPKDPWTLQWKGWNLYDAGVRVLKIGTFEGSGYLGS